MSLVPIESAINPGGDTDAMMVAVLGMIGIFLEITAYGEVYQRTLRWLRRRTGGRWGSNTYPPSRSQGIVGMIWGGIFLLPGVLAYLWVSRIFGVLWSLFPGFLTAMHFYQTFIKRYGGEKGSRQTGIEGEPDSRRRMELLKSQRDAGLLTEREYREKRNELMKKR